MVNIENSPLRLKTEQSPSIQHGTRDPSYFSNGRHKEWRESNKIIIICICIFLYTHGSLCRKVNKIIKKVLRSNL